MTPRPWLIVSAHGTIHQADRERKRTLCGKPYSGHPTRLGYVGGRTCFACWRIAHRCAKR